MGHHGHQIHGVAQLLEGIALGAERPDAALEAIGIDDGGGEALEEIVGGQHLALENAAVDVLVQRDETGSDVFAARLDDLRRCGGVEIADGSDLVARDSDVGGKPGVAGAVEDPAAPDQEIEAWGLGGEGGGNEEQGGGGEAE